LRVPGEPFLLPFFRKCRGVSRLQPSSSLQRSGGLACLGPSIAVGENQSFATFGTFSDGTVQDLSSVAQWSSTDTSVATITTIAGIRLASGVGVGTTTITASLGGVTGSATLTVVETPSL